VVLPPGTICNSAHHPTSFHFAVRWHRLPPPPTTTAEQCTSTVTSREQEQIFRTENGGSILSMMSCASFIDMFNADCVMATGPSRRCSGAVADRGPDSRQLLLRQCTVVVCKLMIRAVQFNGSSPPPWEDSRVRIQRVVGIPVLQGSVCWRHGGARANWTHLPTACDSVTRTLRKTFKLRLAQLQQIFDKYVTWVNVFTTNTINGELLLKRSVIFKCYSFKRTATMTSRDTDRRWKYNSRVKKKDKKGQRGNFQKVKGSVTGIPMISTVWTPSLNIRSYKKLSWKVLTLHFKIFST
jgi:hypothetical protein